VAPGSRRPPPNPRLVHRQRRPCRSRTVPTVVAAQRASNKRAARRGPQNGLDEGAKPRSPRRAALGARRGWRQGARGPRRQAPTGQQRGPGSAGLHRPGRHDEVLPPTAPPPTRPALVPRHYRGPDTFRPSTGAQPSAIAAFRRPSTSRMTVGYDPQHHARPLAAEFQAEMKVYERSGVKPIRWPRLAGSWPGSVSPRGRSAPPPGHFVLCHGLPGRPKGAAERVYFRDRGRSQLQAVSGFDAAVSARFVDYLPRGWRSASRPSPFKVRRPSQAPGDRPGRGTAGLCRTSGQTSPGVRRAPRTSTVCSSRKGLLTRRTPLPWHPLVGGFFFKARRRALTTAKAGAGASIFASCRRARTWLPAAMYVCTRDSPEPKDPESRAPSLYYVGLGT